MKRIALGLDAGGTTTRWIAIDDARSTLAEGKVAGLSALLLHNELGVAKLRTTFAEIAAVLAPTRAHAHELRVCGGFTGVDTHSPELAHLISQAFGIDAVNVAIFSDIEIAYRGAFKPGEGYIVYAGTGSIAAFVDDGNALQRAGGRGVGLDDGGGGYWIAREALRRIWRREDEQPDSWKGSPLARAMFERIGGSDWDRSRAFFYSKERGDIGMLALAVRETADADPLSREILRNAGIELARLANAMISRYGERPIALAGRATRLHPIIEASLREHVRTVPISFVEIEAQRVAAEIAATTTS
ncbi:MAG: BadF/BadG/BcrA/BcrD ATPase family protein [Casimicrobium sp.]